jgi:mutual gliding-motility protein MglA
VAFYNEQTNTITLRIVYDGLGTAGKTTNIRQLHTMFTHHRRGDVHAPETMGARTVYFDWLSMAVGTLDDRYQLAAQVVTVPGQFALVARRWALLQQPDVIVSVCDSTFEGLERSRLGLAFLHRLREMNICPDVPIVVQANKRDLPTAVPIDEFRQAVGMGADDNLVESIASTGEGIRMTFFMALDFARARLRNLLAAGGVGSLPTADQTPADLLVALKTENQDAEWDALEVVNSLGPS